MVQVNEDQLPRKGEIFDNKALGLDGILNKVLKLIVKTRPDFLANTVEAWLKEGLIPAHWRK